MKIIRVLAVAVVLFALVAIVPPQAGAQTPSFSALQAQINTLMGQIASLQAQIAALGKNDTDVIGGPIGGAIGGLVAGPMGGLKGVRFNPEVYNSKGESYGTDWFNAYDTRSVRSQVIEEMKGIRKITGLTHITITFSANRQISWPTPQAAELNRLVQVVNDANAQGLKVVLMIGQPCIVPNSTYTSANPAYDPNYTKIHVGGHKEGETVNGWQLYWDVPYCPDNSITLAERWYGAITSRLQSGVTDPNGIAYMALAGSPQIPFMAEMSVLYDGYPYRNTVLQYLGAVIPYLKAHTTVPIGISLLPATWETTEIKQYAFLDALRNGVPGIFNMLDYIDITSHVQERTYHTSISVPAILSRIGAVSPRKVILSDFRWRDSALDQTASTRWQVQQADSYNLGGWWMWQYKNAQAFIGMREVDSSGATIAGWNQPLTNFIRSIFGLGPLVSVTTSTLPATLTVTYPQTGNILDNSGEKANIANIQWNSSGTGSLPIGIDLLNTTGVIVKHVALYLTNTGNYLWPVDPTIPDGRYDLLVSTQAKEGTPGSAAGRSGYFSLVNNISLQAPSIFLSAQSNGRVADQKLTINVGDTVTISGTPKNLAGLHYGTDYTRAWFFNPSFNNVCSNNSADDTTWWLKCVPMSPGVINVYVEIYRSGVTYRSNVVTITVLATNGKAPKITSVSSKGQGPSQLVIGRDGYIVGTGFLANNTLIIDGWSANVSSTNNGTLIIFTVPNLALGLHVLNLKNANGNVPYKEAVVFFAPPPTVSMIDPNTQLASVLSSLQALIQRLATAFGF